MGGEYLQINGINIHYEEFGNGVPLIGLHGGTSTLEEWRPLAPFFAQDFHIYALDSRAHGRTDNPLGKLSYRMMADDVAAFIKALEIPRPFVCGYSDGGQIALELAMRYPGLTRGLVVGAAWYKFSEAYVNGLKGWGFEQPGQYNFDWVQANFPQFVEDWKRQHHPEDQEYWKSLLLQISELWLTPLNYAETDFKKITEPILVVMGDRDGMISLDNAFEMYQMIPNAELAILPNADHMSVIANPEPYVRIVLEFLMRHSNS